MTLRRLTEQEITDERVFRSWMHDSLHEIRESQIAIFQLGELIMSAITDFAATVNANFATIQTGITNLDAQIQAFQNSPGTLSPTDQAALDAIVASSAQLAAAASAPVVPAVPAAPATPPAVS